MHRKSVILAVAAIATLSGRAASAQTAAGSQSAWSIQPWLDRAYVNFNVGFETTSGTLNDDVTFGLYDGTGTKSVAQNVDSGSLIDVSAGSRVWRNVSVGIGYHRGANTSEASATAAVPHPLSFTDPNRNVSVAAGDLQRTEYAFHLQFGYMLPLSDVMSVHVTAGPSFFRLKQDVLTDITFSETVFPFTSVNTTPGIAERSDSVTGVNVGVDVTYQLYNGGDYKVGGGMFLRYAGASAHIRVLENGNEVDSDVGGLQIGFGARVRF